VFPETGVHALSNATGDEKVPGTFCPSESVDETPASEIREVPGTFFRAGVHWDRFSRWQATNSVII
jgi:hypothetical protein